MTQDVILKKFTAFSKIAHSRHKIVWKKEKKQAKSSAIRKKMTGRQKNLKKSHDELITELNNGHCFSFTINYLVQHHFGKRIWWKALLQTVANWDGKKTSLMHPVLLPDAAPVSSNQKNQDSLGNLIFRAMNYIVPLQTPGKLSILPQNIVQKNVLATNTISFGENDEVQKSYFEYLHNGIIYFIKQHKRIAGQFSKELLMDIFSEESLKDSLILIHDDGHTIGMAWIEGLTWLVYDPNYDHKTPAIEMTGTLDQCLDEVIKIVKTALCLEFASFDPDRIFSLAAYEKIKKDNYDALIADRGFFQVSEFFPDELIAWMEKANQSSSSSRDPFIANIIRLLGQDWNEGNGLTSILMDDSRILLQILNMGRESIHYNEMRQTLTNLIAEKDADDNIYFMSCIEQAESNLIPLLDFLVTDNASLVSVMSLFNQKNDDKQPLWSLLSKQKNGELINFLIRKMTGVEDDFYAKIPLYAGDLYLPELLLHALLLKPSGENTDCTFDVIIKKSPDVLPVITQLLLASPNGFHALVSFLYARVSFLEKSNWDKLSSFPEQKNLLMKCLTEQISKLTAKQLMKHQENICLRQNSQAGWLSNQKPGSSLDLTLCLQKEMSASLQHFPPAQRVSVKRKWSLSA